MSYIDVGELDALRAEFTATLDSTCQITRLSRTSDGAGGTVEVWAPPADYLDPVRCRYRQEGKSGEFPEADRMRERQGVLVVLAHGTVVLEGDRLELEAGVTVEVVGRHLPRTWDLATRVVCEVVS